MPAPQAPTSKNIREEIRAFAQSLGFDACGFASAGKPIDPARRFAAWISAGRHGGMSWLAETAATREDVSQKLPGVRTVVVLARNYYAPRPTAPSRAGRVARYAWGRDYHRVLRRPLITLARQIDSYGDGSKSYISIDTGPIMERAWAQRAGLASIGKNSLGLRRDIGSWFFLATVLTTIELDADPPAEDLCGTCTLCLDACPTQAIVEPYVVDARRCISYQTIENDAEVPKELAALHGDWVFGCDVCQEVCPWNRFAKESSAKSFHPRPGQANPLVTDLLELSDEEFHRRFAGSPLRRAKRAGMQRNARIAHANQKRTAR